MGLGSEIWNFLTLGYPPNGQDPKIKCSPNEARIACSPFSGPLILGPSQGRTTSMRGGPAQLRFEDPVSHYIDQYLRPCMFFSLEDTVGQGQEMKAIADRQAWERKPMQIDGASKM